MATNLNTLVSNLDFETGKKLGTPDLLQLLRAGVDLHNANASQAFTVTDDVLDRDATGLEKRAIVLWATIVYLDQKTVEWSEKAVTISNVAGRTELDSVEWALSKRRSELKSQQLDPLMQRINEAGVLSEIRAQELGETLDLSGKLITATSVIRP